MEIQTNNKPPASDWLRPPAEQEGLSRYVQTLRERLWIVIACVAITTGFAIIYVATASEVYQAQADVLILPAPPADQSVVNVPLIRESSDPTRDVETASRLLTNIDVAERVKESLNSPLSAEDLQAKVKAEPIAQSNIVAVVADAGTPEDAQALANGFAEEGVAEQTDQLHAFIDATLPELEQRAQEEGASPALQDAIAQLRFLRTADVPTLRVETPATLPTSPISPRTRLSIAAGILAGLVLGIAAAFAIQVLDPRLRREEQLRRLYTLPILARIPRESGKAQPDPLNPLGLSPAVAESYRTLRGTLAVAKRSAGNDSTAILVTGSSPSEGKSTTAINLASSLAAAGNSVILIEADLRRPAISRALDVQPDRGIVSVLVESVALEDALITTEEFGPNLGLLLADYEGGWITELFSLPTARQLVDEARRIADFVIIDSPPLTDVIDALPLASYVDYVLLVTRLGKTRLAKLAQLGELLAENGIRPVGFALVGTARPARSDYHYYGARGERLAKPQGSPPSGTRSGS